MKRSHFTSLFFAFILSTFSGCMPGMGSTTYYTALYSISLSRVERPEKATQRYGPQKVDVITGTSKYKYVFEDSLVRILWLATSREVQFSIENKTDHSIRIPWDEAAYVDETGRSHRVMHSGIKYTDREQAMPPSVIVRKGVLDDLVFPTDYVSWQSGSAYSAGDWEKEPLFLDFDWHGYYTKAKYASLAAFSVAVNQNVGKTYQVLLPLQIEEVINDYIFTFKVDSVSSQTNKS